MRASSNRNIAFLSIAFAHFVAQPVATRADVVAAYELTEPAVVPGGGVVAVIQGGPGRPLEITLDDTPGDYTIKVLFASDVDAATALWGYATKLSTSADTIAATALSYGNSFDYGLDPPDLVLSSGPGIIVNEATQGAFTPWSGMLEMFEVTLIVSVPTAEVRIFTTLGDYTWASIDDPFLITIADSDPLSSDTMDTTNTPSIIIRTFVQPPVDCNTNSIPDASEIAALPNLDCNTNSTLDSCEIASDPSLDCDTNGAIDACEIAGQPVLDCNANGILDGCEIAGSAVDCNSNGVPDSCELAAGAADCDANGVPDSCDLAAVMNDDCDWNSVLDRCEIASGAALDCNSNGRPDRCDVASGQSADSNANGVPDECDLTVSALQQTQDQNGPSSRAIDRQSLRSALAMILGISGEGGFLMSDLPRSILGPLGIPMSILLGGLEIVNYPARIVIYELTYTLLDALLP